MNDRLLTSEQQAAGSHHGDPQLFTRDTALIRAYQVWIRTAHKAAPDRYPKGWEPSYIDCLKSRLFWRIRSGKTPLPHPPPCAYSCPWYELIEEDRPHWCWEEFRTYEPGYFKNPKPLVSIAQSLYELVEKQEGGLMLSYGPYHFKAWRGQAECPAMIDGKVIEVPRDGWYIQYLKNVEIA